MDIRIRKGRAIPRLLKSDETSLKTSHDVCTDLAKHMDDEDAAAVRPYLQTLIRRYVDKLPEPGPAAAEAVTDEE